MLQKSCFFCQPNTPTLNGLMVVLLSNASGVLRCDLQPLRWISKGCECERKAMQAEDRAIVTAAASK